ARPRCRSPERRSCPPAGLGPPGSKPGERSHPHRSASMETTHTIVVGAGQAGLALSACLSERGHEHVLLERGRIAERWHSERWDSLRLLTPNWMTRLPGYSYAGPDPDGFMSARQTARFFADYAAAFAAPVREQTEVIRLSQAGDGFVVDATTG